MSFSKILEKQGRADIPYVDKISRGFNFASDENFQFLVDLISRLRLS